jgi:hypothetical protein
MAEAKERSSTPVIPSDMQAVLKRCENLEKEVRSLKLNLSFMNRWVECPRTILISYQDFTSLISTSEYAVIPNSLCNCRKDSEQTKQIEDLQKQNEDMAEEKERLQEEIERLASDSTSWITYSLQLHHILNSSALWKSPCSLDTDIHPIVVDGLNVPFFSSHVPIVSFNLY